MWLQPEAAGCVPSPHNLYACGVVKYQGLTESLTSLWSCGINAPSHAMI
jgi:hypothetical protein